MVREKLLTEHYQSRASSPNSTASHAATQQGVSASGRL